MLHISLQNITTCSYSRRYRQSTVYTQSAYLPKAALTFTAYGFLLPDFISFENVSDVYKIEIAEQFVQIKWKVLHSPKFVSLMIFLVQTSVHTCSNHCQSSLQKNSSQLSFSLFHFFSFGRLVLQIPPLYLFGLFLLKQPAWSRPSEAIFVPTEASKTFNGATSRTSVYTYLPYTVLCGFILLRLCRIWLQVNFQFFLISNLIQKSCQM